MELFVCSNCVFFKDEPLTNEKKLRTCKELGVKETKKPCKDMILNPYLVLSKSLNEINKDLYKLTEDELNIVNVLVHTCMKAKNIIKETGFSVGDEIIYYKDEIKYNCQIIGIQLNNFILQTFDKTPLTFITSVGNISYPPVKVRDEN